MVRAWESALSEAPPLSPPSMALGQVVASGVQGRAALTSPSPSCAPSSSVVGGTVPRFQDQCEH